MKVSLGKKKICVIFKEMNLNFELEESSKILKGGYKLKKKKLSIRHGIFRIVML